MTNAEKYLKDGVDIEELSNDIESYIKFYGGFDTKEFFEDESWCNQSTKAKPTLTEDERVILNFIKNFDYIGRNEKGLYYKLQDEDVKEKTAVIYNLTTNLFQFIKERRRILC